jgi:16S rRNA (cytosine1402-N4)-methyltransferase
MPRSGCARTHHGSYEGAHAGRERRLATVDAALLDLGASSLQPTPRRAASFQAPGPLDIRWIRRGRRGADIVNKRTPRLGIFARLGEEPMAERVAKAIASGAQGPVPDTLRLAETVSRTVGGRRGKLHPATRVFQALRIANQRRLRLRRGLPAVAHGEPGGRFAVIGSTVSRTAR